MNHPWVAANAKKAQITIHPRKQYLQAHQGLDQIVDFELKSAGGESHGLRLGRVCSPICPEAVPKA